MRSPKLVVGRRLSQLTWEALIYFERGDFGESARRYREIFGRVPK
jgi:hypothetical protein